MNASVQVMFLVIVVAVSTIFAFFLEVRRGVENDRFVEWLKTKRKPDWDALTRSDRFLTIRAVEILRRGALADDAESLPSTGWVDPLNAASGPDALV